jgi:hypothetical protein
MVYSTLGIVKHTVGNTSTQSMRINLVHTTNKLVVTDNTTLVSYSMEAWPYLERFGSRADATW